MPRSTGTTPAIIGTIELTRVVEGRKGLSLLAIKMKGTYQVPVVGRGEKSLLFSDAGSELRLDREKKK